MIGPAGPDDVAGLVRLERLALGADAWSEALIEQGVAGTVPTTGYLVAREGDAVTGYAVTSVAGDVAELQRIAVDPRYRRRGVATRLLDVVVGQARRSGAERLLLEVREDNGPALAFYAARGFVELDRRPRYYRDGATAVVMLLPMRGPDVKECSTA